MSSAHPHGASDGTARVATCLRAAEEQLGLKFQIRGESADVMIIDDVQPPTGN